MEYDPSGNSNSSKIFLKKFIVIIWLFYTIPCVINAKMW